MSESFLESDKEFTTKELLEKQRELKDTMRIYLDSPEPSGEMAQDAYTIELAILLVEIEAVEFEISERPDRREYWITKDGKAILMTDMEDVHVINSIRWMRREYSKYLEEVPFDQEPMTIFQLFPKFQRLNKISQERNLSENTTRWWEEFREE